MGALQSTAANRAKQLAFLEKALKEANRQSGWTMGAKYHLGIIWFLCCPRTAETERPVVLGWQHRGNLRWTVCTHWQVDLAQSRLCAGPH